MSQSAFGRFLELPIANLVAAEQHLLLGQITPAQFKAQAAALVREYVCHYCACGKGKLLSTAMLSVLNNT